MVSNVVLNRKSCESLASVIFSLILARDIVQHSSLCDPVLGKMIKTYKKSKKLPKVNQNRILNGCK
jgi:hypothetical protein